MSTLYIYPTKGSYYELYHSGVKGQKWGIRRYQNPDGTLTEEGKRHYGRKLTRMSSREGVHRIKAGAEYNRNRVKNNLKSTGVLTALTALTNPAAAVTSAVSYLAVDAIDYLTTPARRAFYEKQAQKVHTNINDLKSELSKSGVNFESMPLELYVSSILQGRMGSTNYDKYKLK